MENKTVEIPKIPFSEKKRIVIAGAGFAGLKLARRLIGKGFQIILIDKNNFHQFQPLLYQVATAGLEPSAISFPLRKVLQKATDVHFRIAELERVDGSKNEITTNIGRIKYDYLVLSMGVKNRLLIFLNWSWNYFTYDQSLRLLIKPKVLLNQQPIKNV
jgi:NADH dehydrogenase